jgi:hypothetical protein
MNNQEKIKNVVDFHGEIDWFTLDCYPKNIQKKLKNLPISTYTVRIGNDTIHYGPWQLPKQKDFYHCDFSCSELSSFDAVFFKELRQYIRKSRYFNKSKNTIEKAKALTKKSY